MKEIPIWAAMFVQLKKDQAAVVFNRDGTIDRLLMPEQKRDDNLHPGSATPGPSRSRTRRACSTPG